MEVSYTHSLFAEIDIFASFQANAQVSNLTWSASAAYSQTYITNRFSGTGFLRVASINNQNAILYSVNGATVNIWGSFSFSSCPTTDIAIPPGTAFTISASLWRQLPAGPIERLVLYVGRQHLCRRRVGRQQEPAPLFELCEAASGAFDGTHRWNRTACFRLLSHAEPALGGNVALNGNVACMLARSRHIVGELHPQEMVHVRAECHFDA